MRHDWLVQLSIQRPAIDTLIENTVISVSLRVHIMVRDWLITSWMVDKLVAGVFIVGRYPTLLWVMDSWSWTCILNPVQLLPFAGIYFNHVPRRGPLLWLTSYIGNGVSVTEHDLLLDLSTLSNTTSRCGPHTLCWTATLLTQCDVPPTDKVLSSRSMLPNSRTVSLCACILLVLLRKVFVSIKLYSSPLLFLDRLSG